MDAPFNFPAEISLRIIGPNNLDFPSQAVDTVRQFAPEAVLKSTQGHASQGGKYLAVIIVFTAESKGQYDAIQQALSQLDGVKMIL